MELHFESIQQFEEMFNDRNTMIKLNTTECDCGEYLEMQIDKVTITIGEYKAIPHRKKCQIPPSVI